MPPTRQSVVANWGGGTFAADARNCVSSSACEGVESPTSLMFRDNGQAQVDRQNYLHREHGGGTFSVAPQDEVTTSPTD